MKIQPASGLSPEEIERIEAVRKFFAESGDGRTLAQIALSWVWTKSGRAIPIPGFRTLAQVQENIRRYEDSFGLIEEATDLPKFVH